MDFVRWHLYKQGFSLNLLAFPRGFKNENIHQNNNLSMLRNLREC